MDSEDADKEMPSLISLRSVLKVAGLGVSSLIVLAGAYHFPPALSHGMVDQRADIITDSGYFLAGFGSLSQYFTPTKNSISGIDLALGNIPYIIGSMSPVVLLPVQSQAVANSFSMSILDPNGVTLVLQTYTLAAGSPQSYYHFDFDPLNLVPGNSYIIRLSSTGGSSTGYITWYFDPNNPYPGGSGSQAGEDFGFRTYFLNSAPVAFDQSVSTDAGNQVVITLDATDADSEPLTFEIRGGPFNGIIEPKSGDGRILEYTPNPNFIGQDSFTFRANDGLSGSNIATVEISVINSPARIEIWITHASADDPTDQATQEYRGGLFTVPEKRIVTIDASKSHDPDGELRFNWSQTYGPVVNFGDPEEPIIRFVAPSVSSGMDLSFQLTVDDGTGGVTHSDLSIRLFGTNLPPIADAGSDMIVNPGQVLALDGRGSSDPDQDPLTYSWTQLSAGSILEIVDITNPNSPTPSFVSPNIGNTTLTFQLEVSDPTGASDTDSVSIAIGNRPPIANAGSDIIASPGDRVTLDGRGSSDPDQDPLTYSWTQRKSQSILESIDIIKPDSSTPYFVVPDIKDNTRLIFQLEVSDSTGARDIDTVIVTLSGPVVDFTVTVTPQSSVISQGGSIEFEVEVTQTSGEIVPISLDVIVPEDSSGRLSVEYDNTPATPPFKRVVNIRAAENLSEDQYSILITASSEGIEKLVHREVEFPLIVKTQGDLTAVFIGALVGVPIAAFVFLSHFVIPKPATEPTFPAGEGHTFGLQIEVQLDEIGGIIQGAGSMGTIPNFSDISAKETISNSFNQLLMQDTGETFQQFKQFKMVKGWLKKCVTRANNSSGVIPSAIGGGEVGGDIGSELKKIIAENLGKTSAPDLVRMIKHALFSEAATRLEKGIESTAIPLPPIRASILFIPIIDGVPVKNNLLRVPFELLPVTELKGAKTILSGDIKSFFADFVDLRMKLYYLMPMMLGMKKVRFGENLVHVAKNVSVKINKD